MIKALAVLALLPVCLGFAPVSTGARTASMAIAAARSKSLPFLDQPKALDGTLPGDVGFDPLNLSGIEFDFSSLVVPPKWKEGRSTYKTIDWMVESELKHGRICMLAVVGFLAVDFGVHFPGTQYEGVGPIAAHDAMVKSGNMGFMFLLIAALELVNGAAIFDQAKGSGRKPGEFNFDPLSLGKDSAKYQRYSISEVKNGRLAMLAFAGLITQAVLTGKSFPYF